MSDEVWEKFQELSKDFVRLKEDLSENAPHTYEKLTEDLESLVSELDEMYSYYSMQ